MKEAPCFAALLRLVVVLVILVGVGGVLPWVVGQRPHHRSPAAAVGTTGRIDTDKAKAGRR